MTILRDSKGLSWDNAFDMHTSQGTAQPPPPVRHPGSDIAPPDSSIAGSDTSS